MTYNLRESGGSALRNHNKYVAEAVRLPYYLSITEPPTITQQKMRVSYGFGDSTKYI